MVSFSFAKLFIGIMEVKNTLKGEKIKYERKNRNNIIYCKFWMDF